MLPFTTGVTNYKAILSHYLLVVIQRKNHI